MSSVLLLEDKWLKRDCGVPAEEQHQLASQSFSTQAIRGSAKLQGAMEVEGEQRGHTANHNYGVLIESFRKPGILVLFLTYFGLVVVALIAGVRLPYYCCCCSSVVQP